MAQWGGSFPLHPLRTHRTREAVSLSGSDSDDHLGGARRIPHRGSPPTLTSPGTLQGQGCWFLPETVPRCCLQMALFSKPRDMVFSVTRRFVSQSATRASDTVRRSHRDSQSGGRVWGADSGKERPEGKGRVGRRESVIDRTQHHREGWRWPQHRAPRHRRGSPCASSGWMCRERLPVPFLGARPAGETWTEGAVQGDVNAVARGTVRKGRRDCRWDRRREGGGRAQRLGR